MMKSQAKKLKPGQRVVWDGTDGRVEGTVIRRRYNTVWIKWDDGLEKTHYADTMDRVFTPGQLEQIATEQRIAEEVKAYNQRLLNQPKGKQP
jgi:hypothetical protein